MLVKLERLSLKILQSEKVALRRLAMVEGEPMSVVIRHILREELKRRNMLNPSPEPTPNQQEAQNGTGQSQ